MTFDEVRQAIEGRFANEWTDRTPIHWPGHDFNTDDGGAEYVHLSYTFGKEIRKTFGAPGANLRRSAGVVFLDVNVRRDQHPGTARLNNHTDFARPIFIDGRSGLLDFVPKTPGSIRFGVSADTILTPWITRTLRWGFTVDVHDA